MIFIHIDALYLYHTEGCYFALDQRNVLVFSRWQEEEQSSGPVSSFLDSWESIIAYSHCRPCSTAIAISCCRCSPVHVHSARAMSFAKFSVPFLCPRFIAHVFMIATNCCRISKSNFSAHKSCQTLRHQRKIKVLPGWCWEHFKREEWWLLFFLPWPEERE